MGVFTVRLNKILKWLCGLLIAVMLSGAQARELTEEQIQNIEYYYRLEKYMVGGCLLGATFGAITGYLALTGLTVVAAVPYISTGCSLGFLTGASTMLIYEFFDPPATEMGGAPLGPEANRASR